MSRLFSPAVLITAQSLRMRGAPVLGIVVSAITAKAPPSDLSLRPVSALGEGQKSRRTGS